MTLEDIILVESIGMRYLSWMNHQWFKRRRIQITISLQGHGCYDELVVPVIENTAYENELTDSLAKANKGYFGSN